MTTYARIVNGIMIERIDPALDADGNEIPIEQRFHPLLVAKFTEIDPENPPPTQPPAPPPHDWRPDAQSALKKMRSEYLATLATMFTYYQAQSMTAEADIVAAAMNPLTTIETYSTIKAVLDDPAGTREQFDAAVSARWNAIVGSAPANVKLDFKNFSKGG